MPGKYDTGSRAIIVETDFESEGELATTTLINGVICDLLYQSSPENTRKLEYARYPELLDLAVVATGLGMLRCDISLVSKAGPFWDSTQWETMPRPFLNSQSMAYANAIVAWVRDEVAPQWANDLNGEIKKPMKNSLKYLHKTNDSFFNPAKRSTLEQSQNEWWNLVQSPLVSTQVVSVRHLNVADAISDQQTSQLVSKLQNNNPAVVLNTIAKVEHMETANDKIVRELRELVNDRSEEVRSKAMLALTRLEQLDDRTIESAVEMLESSAIHNVFAGVIALGSQDTVAEGHMDPIDRAFMRALKSCNYEFVGLFAAAYNRWMDDPKSHVQEMLEQHNPEHLQIALEALDGTPEELVALGDG